MGSRQLANLERLSEKQEQKSRRLVNHQQAELDQLSRQHDELKFINSEYQKESANDDFVTPAMLAHRRTFVTRLAEQIDQLNIQREKQAILLQQQISSHRLHASRNAAVTAVRENVEMDENLAANRLEQRLSDESYQMAKASNDAQMKGDEHG